MLYKKHPGLQSPSFYSFIGLDTLYCRLIFILIFNFSHSLESIILYLVVLEILSAYIKSRLKSSFLYLLPEIHISKSGVVNRNISYFTSNQITAMHLVSYISVIFQLANSLREWGYLLDKGCSYIFLLQ